MPRCPLQAFLAYRKATGTDAFQVSSSARSTLKLALIDSILGRDGMKLWVIMGFCLCLLSTSLSLSVLLAAKLWINEAESMWLYLPIHLHSIGNFLLFFISILSLPAEAAHWHPCQPFQVGRVFDGRRSIFGRKINFYSFVRWKRSTQFWNHPQSCYSSCLGLLHFKAQLRSTDHWLNDSKVLCVISAKPFRKSRLFKSINDRDPLFLKFKIRSITNFRYAYFL